ncbi:MAG: nucleotidyltransferase family protein [Pseudomonadota bacterium]
MNQDPSTRSLEVLMRLITPGSGHGVSATEIDWEEIDHLARHSHVTVALWMRLRNDPLLEKMPASMVIDLRRTFHESVRRNRLLKSQFTSVAKCLNRNGQTPVMLKGAAYLFDPPAANIGRRYMHDLDFMAADAEACHRSLKEAGFEQIEEATSSTHHHLAGLTDRMTGLEVEVHRRPFKTADAAMRQLFLTEAVHLEAAGASMMLPSRACRIVSNVIHAQLSDNSFAKGLFNPRYLLEFAEYALAWPKADWELAEAAMRGNNLAYGNFRYLVRELMGIQPPVHRKMRRLDGVHLSRIRRRKRVSPRTGIWYQALGRLFVLKDFVRRRVGRWFGWRSVSRARLKLAGDKR